MENLELEQTVEQCDVVAALLNTRRRAVETAVAPLHDRIRTGRATRHDFLERDRLEQELRLIDEGAGPEAGTSPEHSAILRHPEVLALRLARPGLASIARLRAQAREQLDVPAGTALFVYTGPKGAAAVDGRGYLEPGDLVSLSHLHARAWGDRVRPVGEA